MIKKDEYLKPQKIKSSKGSAWFYVNKRSIDFVHEVRNKDGNFIRTDTFRIPLKRVMLLVKQQEK